MLSWVATAMVVSLITIGLAELGGEGAGEVWLPVSTSLSVCVTLTGGAVDILISTTSSDVALV